MSPAESAAETDWGSAPPDRGTGDLIDRFDAVRDLTVRLAAPLSAEDQQIQSMDDVSPTKWHLAHVTWFFETFLLKPFVQGYVEFHPHYNFLFNSYYEGVGPRHARARRGQLSRPALTDVMAYRAHVDAAVTAWLATEPERENDSVRGLIDLGLNHEQQHQELLLMDIKHVFSCNPLAPAYHAEHREVPATGSSACSCPWFDIPGGRYDVGHAGDGFAFDNEGPAHGVLLPDFRIAARPVTNGEFCQFVADGGYRRPEFWHSDGWSAIAAGEWTAPLYWRERDGDWDEFTLAGLRPLDRDAPVCHVSFYEAAAYAAWAGKRLPTEFEWEVAGRAGQVDDRSAPAANLMSADFLQPVAAPSEAPTAPAQMLGDVWEWTQSAYAPYPGFRAAEGAVGEYNGKFMVNQMVLRGGCCATPPGHIRLTYRNFFYPHQRWAFSGFRLAE